MTNRTITDLCLRVVSYNYRGLNNFKKDFNSSLHMDYNHCQFLFLHEHWLSDIQCNDLGILNANNLFTSVLNSRSLGGIGCVLMILSCC